MQFFTLLVEYNDLHEARLVDRQQIRKLISNDLMHKSPLEIIESSPGIAWTFEARWSDV